MSETIYNIFLPFTDERCSHALYVAHETDLEDDAAVAFLQARVNEDLRQAIHVPLRASFTRQEYYARIRLGEGGHLYDEVFRLTGAGPSPLFVTTIVVEGQTRINATARHGDPDIYLTPGQIGDARMDDWITKYTRDGAFDLPQLIHDDYFLAIKLTFNAGLYVSATKLLVSCIDSIAYIEYGDERRFQPFVQWLKGDERDPSDRHPCDHAIPSEGRARDRSVPLRRPLPARRGLRASARPRLPRS